MSLYVSRFAGFPYFFKLFTTLFSIITLIALMGAPSSPGGSSLIWFTVVISLMTDLLLIAVLLFELDRIKIPLKGVSHSSMESATSLALSIFYFITIWLCINAEEFTSSAWFYIAAFTSFANFTLYTADFAIYLRAWMVEQRTLISDNAVYDFPSYGSP